VSKGERTRAHILRTAAPVFNQRGYAGSSVADLVKATGLERGGIYRHFESKEVLALEAFDNVVAELGRRQRALMSQEAHAVDRLLGFVQFFREMVSDPPLPGGCPVMNTAIESDHGRAAFRERAQRAMGHMRAILCRTTREGQACGGIRSEVNPEQIATVMVATLEGALMLTLLYEDPVHMEHAAAHLEQHLEDRVRAR
jgi:TetR/AcrR family transcriptional regulator, transcriptional repressor for nem operon